MAVWEPTLVQACSSTYGFWKGGAHKSFRLPVFRGSSCSQENSNYNYPRLKKKKKIRKKLAVNLGCSIEQHLAVCNQETGPKSGRPRHGERQGKTTTPMVRRGSDACALCAGCPCGPRAGSAAPLRCGGGHGGTFPGPKPGPGRAAPAPSVPGPCPNSDSCAQPGFNPYSGSYSGTSPRPSCSPSREHRDWGGRGRKWGAGQWGGSGSTWPESAAAR